MKRILLTLCAIILPMLVWAQSEAELHTIEKIKSNPDKYYWGEAVGYNEASVLSDAQVQLSRSIRSFIVYNGKNVVDDDKEHYTENLMIASTVKLYDMNKIVYDKTSSNGERQVVAFIYISKEQFAKDYAAENERMAQRVYSLIKEGKIQESKVNIADALKYFNWAINLARFYKMHNSLAETDNRPLDMWLDEKIKSILTNIDVTIADGGIKTDTDSYEKYSINLNFTYAGRPISLAEFRYFTGETNLMVGVKNGEAVVKYPNLDAINEIKLNILYAYDGENDLDEEMMSVYKSQPRKMYDNYNVKRVPIKVIKTQVKPARFDMTKEETALLQEVRKTEVGSISPTVKALKKETERDFLTEKEEMQAYLAASDAIMNAINNRKYDDVKHLFNADAYERFMKMVSMGNMSVSKTPSYTLERSGQYIRCGRIPVSVKTDNKMRNENIILRFNPEDKKVSSVSYSLTENSENDIFRDCQWSLDARYTLLKFMEDYQTAFAIKDLNYLESILSDNVIVITGNIVAPVSKLKVSFDLPVEFQTSVVNGIRYDRFDKKSYLKHLAEVFRKNNYVYLTFHDAVITKASTPEGMAEAYWIELLQDHNSTRYNDKGYLTLQIGMKSKGAIIYVRTWTPNFISLEEMKRRYPFEEEHE